MRASSNFSRFKQILEFASLLLVILVSSLVLFTLWSRSRSSPGTADIKPKGIATTEALVGKKLKLPEARIGPGSLSVVFVLSTKCKYCESFVPLYKKLITAEKNSNSTSKLPSQPKVQIVLAFSDQPSEVNHFLIKHDLNPSTVVYKSLADLGVAGTPTMLIVNPESEIEQAVLGRLTKSQIDLLVRRVKGFQSNFDLSPSTLE